MRKAFLTFVFLAACKPAADEGAFDLPGYDPTGGAQPEALCLADGGTWAQAGKAGMACYFDTEDAGQSCSSGSECEGLCLARSRTCAPVRPLFGCHEILGDTGAEATICVD